MERKVGVALRGPEEKTTYLCYPSVGMSPSAVSNRTCINAVPIYNDARDQMDLQLPTVGHIWENPYAGKRDVAGATRQVYECVRTVIPRGEA